MRNLRLAYRTLFRTPLVTGVAVLSLALGIGANAAIYSLFHELLLAPLPVPHPEQLVNFGGNTPSPGSHQTTQAGGDSRWVFSYAMLRDLEAQPGPFSGIAGHQDFSPNIAFRRNTVNVSAEYVSGSYFPVLGVKPALGRLIGPDEDKVIGANPYVVLSHAYWTNQLGSDPSVLGQNITVNGQIFRIIGVAAAGFEGTTLGNKPDLFVPLTMRGALEGFNGYQERTRYWVYIFARLKPGVTLAQAQARENVLYHRIINEVELPLQKNVSEKTLAQFRRKQLELVNGRRGASDLHEQTEMPMLLLFGTTLFVLVIACANIANLLLARAANRATEIAVRLSLGATRRQLLAQLLTESVLLAVLGGLAGLIVAWATLRGLVLLLPEYMSSTISFALDGRAIAFAAVLSLVTGILFGLFPALHSTSPDLVTALRSGSGKTSATRGAARFRTSLVTAQIALSMALLASAGLFLESLANVSRVNLGVNIDGLITFNVSPALNGYSGARTQEIYSSIDRELSAIPGVSGVAAARVPILAGNNWDNDVNVQGFPRTPDTDADAYFNAVGPAFFHTMGIPLLSGREFTPSDVLDAPRVAIVNETFVKKFGLAGKGAVGKMIGARGGDSLTHLIVGVVKDSHYSNVKQELRPVYYLPYKQDTSSMGDMNFYVRSAAAPDGVMPQIRAAVARVDRTLPVVRLKTMPQQIHDNVYLDRMITTLTAAFAGLATLLAAIGLYGVLAYSVVQRTKEIGVRIALGADPRTIVGMVLRHVGAMTLAGAVIGVLGALGIGRAAQSMLFGVQGRDPLVMLVALVAMGGVALVAGSIPAWRAARVDPVKALKWE